MNIINRTRYLPLKETLELVGGERLNEGLIAEERPDDLEAVEVGEIKEGAVILS